MRALFLALASFLCGSLAAAEINVYAASSLTAALEEIGATYQTRSGDKIAFNFAASNTLARQIEEGAPADIFFSADHAQMDSLARSGRVKTESIRDLLSNTLVVVAPADSGLVLKSAADLQQVSRIAVGDPKFVPVGVYARAYLEKAGLWKELEGKIIPAENVRAGMAIVESGNADVAFVYATDAQVSKKVKVVLRISPEDAPPIQYPAALVKQSPEKPEAEKFLRHLASDDARKIFEKFGFVVSR